MFTAFLVVVLWKFDVMLDVLKAIWEILFPFVLGGAIAFVTNVPMSFLEKKIFGRVKKENKIVVKLARPISLLLTIILAVGVIVLVMFGVIPQLTRTMGTVVVKHFCNTLFENSPGISSFKWCFPIIVGMRTDMIVPYVHISV